MVHVRTLAGLLCGLIALLLGSYLWAFLLLLVAEDLLLLSIRNPISEESTIHRATRIARLFWYLNLPAVVVGFVLVFTTRQMWILALPVSLTQTLSCLYYLASLSKLRATLQKKQTQVEAELSL